MDLTVNLIGKEENERIVICCYSVTDEVNEIVSFIKSRQGQLSGIIDGTQYEIPISDVYYAEGVDNRVFIYCKDKVYETRSKLYELEESLKEKRFLRVSKSMLLNLMKIESIKPALNGRFTAVIQSGEKIIISRKYVPELKKALKGGEE